MGRKALDDHVPHGIGFLDVDDRHIRSDGGYKDDGVAVLPRIRHELKFLEIGSRAVRQNV